MSPISQSELTTNAPKMISWTYLIFSLIVLLNLHHVVGAEDGQIPEIWPAIRADKSYRIMYQFQMFQSPERITVEEWASFDKQLFRFDLISSETRITYLVNGGTNEVFRYKPFVCDQLSPDSKELGVIGNLFKGYSLSKGLNQTMAYGLGPLWLRTKQDAKDVIVMSDESRDFRRHKFLTHFNGYEVNFNGETSEIPYKLRLYFQPTPNRFLDVVEWMNPANKTQSSNPNNVEARAKLMYADLSPIDDSIFDLPLGYGCKRGKGQEEGRDGTDSAGLDLLHDGNSNQALLEVTTSRPRDGLLNTWMSQRFTINLMRGSLRLNERVHSYYVTSTQQIDPKTSRLRRTKRVWSAIETSKTDAIVYTIEETNGDCTVERMNFDHLVRLPFPAASSSKYKTGGTGDGLIMLGIDLITNLFNDHSDYHLLRERSDTVGEAQALGANSSGEAYYEKRLDNYEIKSMDNGVIWSGPVSIVKRIKTFTISLDNAKPLVSTYHTTVTLFLYDKNQTEILFKAVFNLMASGELDISYLHKKLDIGACFSASQKKDILIKYPMESQEFSRRLSAIDDLVRDRFLINLFGTTPIQPIQVSNLELSFDNFFMYAKMTLIELPLRQTFNLKRGLQLGKVKKGDESALIKKIASSVDKCATSCDYYGCFRFSYYHIELKCLLELKDGIAELEQNYSSDLYEYVKYSINSAWSRYDESGGRAHLRPSTVLELFKELITYESLDASSPNGQQLFEMPYENVPLRIFIDTELLAKVDPDKTEFIELRPISVHSDMDSINEFVKEEEEETENQQQLTNGTDKQQSVVRVYDGSNLQIQYTILMESRQFNQDIKQQLEDASYDDCAELCESNDCRSFSYCESKRHCLVTNLHKKADIKRASVDNPLCSVHALDYLSKFEDFGWAQTPVVVKSVIEGTSKEDCANACMEETNFNCQGFYHCSKYDMALEDKTISCILQDKHIEDMDPEGRSLPKFKKRFFMSEDSERIGLDCRYFSRSYLAQFDEYLGKELKFDKPTTSGDGGAATAAEETGIEIMPGLGAENCAKYCIQESCLAFHVCLDQQDHSLVCSIAKKQVRKDNLVTRKRCTTFILSDKSQFNLRGIKLISAEPDRLALNSDNDAPDVVIDPEKQDKLENDINASLFDKFWKLEAVKQIKDGSSHFWAKFLTLLFGSLVGVVCAIGWLERDSIYNLVTRINSHFRARG